MVADGGDMVIWTGIVVTMASTVGFFIVRTLTSIDRRMDVIAGSVERISVSVNALEVDLRDDLGNLDRRHSDRIGCLDTRVSVIENKCTIHHAHHTQ